MSHAKSSPAIENAVSFFFPLPLLPPLLSPTLSLLPVPPGVDSATGAMDVRMPVEAVAREVQALDEREKQKLEALRLKVEDLLYPEVRRSSSPRRPRAPPAQRPLYCSTPPPPSSSVARLSRASRTCRILSRRLCLSDPAPDPAPRPSCLALRVYPRARAGLTAALVVERRGAKGKGTRCFLLFFSLFFFFGAEKGRTPPLKAPSPPSSRTSSPARPCAPLETARRHDRQRVNPGILRDPLRSPIARSLRPCIPQGDKEGPALFDDIALLRFLRARNFKSSKAEVMLRKAHKIWVSRGGRRVHFFALFHTHAHTLRFPPPEPT